jgi:hypothetical protein
MNMTYVRALMDGAGSITLFPDRSRSMGTAVLRPWRLAGQTAMFLMLMLSLVMAVVLIHVGVSDGWAVAPYLICMAIFVSLQIRHARVPAA